MRSQLVSTDRCPARPDTGTPPAALTTSLAGLRHEYRQRPDSAARTEHLTAVEAWTRRSGSGYVVDAFWSAWDAFDGADTYRETIERAVRYGTDTDTTAAIAGGLAGIHFGLSGIPSEWLDGMRGRPIVDPLIGRLTDGALPPW